MAEIRFDKTWGDITNIEDITSIAEGRECGPCYACCVYLGIKELKKWSGQTCKHLDGGKDPTKRCSIYDKRPSACSVYECAWRSGLGPDNLRPYESGILITMYKSETNENMATVTIIIIDAEKAKTHNIEEVAIQIILLPHVEQLRIVNYKNKSATLFQDGFIYKCKLLPGDDYEALSFVADLAHPIAKYRME